MVTTITKTIKPSGGDYSDPQTAWNDMRTIVGSTNLVAADTAVVLEMYRGEYDSFTASNSYTVDATRNITFRAAEGEDHGGNIRGGVRIVAASAGPAITVEASFVQLEGLTFVARNGSASDYGVWLLNAYGCAIRKSIILADGSYSVLAQANNTDAAATTTLENILAIGDGTSSDRYIDLRGTTGAGGEVSYVVANCSAFDSQYFVRVGTSGDATSTCNVTLVNNFAGSCYYAYQTSGSGTLNVTGGGNVGGALDPFPAAIQASDQTWDIGVDITVASDGNNAIYSTQTKKLVTADGNDARLVGVGPDVNSNVPREDITGQIRTGNIVNPGAFQSLTHTWTVMAYSNSPLVNVDGVIKVDTDNVNVYHDTLTVTGASGTDNTPVLPVGTNGLWLSMKQMSDSTTTAQIDLELSVSNSITLVHMGSVITAASAPLVWKCPMEIQANDGTYPRIKMTVAGGATNDTVLEVLAIGAQNSDGSWS